MSASGDGAPPRHLARLDVLRAAAFLAVYAFHSTIPFPSARIFWHGLFADYSAWPKQALILLPIAFGWLGVALFFVLSGFCIHYATLRRKTATTTRDFYGRRFLRIYPAYFVALVVFSLLSPWLPNLYFNAWQVAAHLLMIHNFLNATFFGINGSFWSLAVEVQFYLLYPLLLQLIARGFSLPRCLALSLVLNLACQIYFSRRGGSWNPIHATWSFPLVTWCDWILGACLADAYVKKQRLFSRENTWLICSGAALLLALQVRPLFAQSYLFACVFFAVLIQRYLAAPSSLNRLERVLIPVGTISYSLYLWHEPILLLCETWGSKLASFRDAPLLRAALFDLLLPVLVLTLIASASYYVLEVRAPAVIRGFLTRRHVAAPPLPGIALTPPLGGKDA